MQVIYNGVLRGGEGVSECNVFKGGEVGNGHQDRLI